MTDKTTEEAIIDALVENLGVERSSITPESKIVDDLGADSLDVVELVMYLEEDFEITLEDSDVEKVVTVADAVTLIDSILADQ